MLRKKHSEPAQPDGQQALLEFETPADQPGKKDPKQFFKKNWKKITAVVCVAAVAAAVLLPRKSAKPAQADVYYYNASAKTVWIYSRKAAGRITAVSPSASAPTSVTVAGTSYTIANSSVASQLSSLNGGGVGQVVTLLLGMNNEAVAVLTGEQADEVFYGVVQTAARSLVEENGADVQQKVSVLCTDGATRTVNIAKDLNYPAGWMVKITVDENGEQVESLKTKSISGTVNADGTALGDTAFADGVEILDTTSEGVAGTVSPSRLSGVTLSGADVRYYTTNEAGQIDRLILNNATGDLWTYGVLDDVKNLINTATDTKSSASSGSSGSTSASDIASDVAGGVAIGKSTSGTVKSMRQLLPAVIDKVGAASVMSGGKKYETADDMQVYLWYKGTYYPTTLSQVNSEDYSLIGWYDANGSAARGKIRVLIAVKKD